ncbi:hypothetical protein [Coxiella endosymbiont of Ornithodoros maritimus]|uniref:hypothetical protein n=1 Tax=Coxiella endosymbiont of Ornithodoros maritimus TaxID=1656172 RepID=UPI00226494BC|nr:hypothetical protein [Coxiella endosymbiont of Ornithodoros maritimus]
MCHAYPMGFLNHLSAFLDLKETIRLKMTNKNLGRRLTTGLLFSTSFDLGRQKEELELAE